MKTMEEYYKVLHYLDFIATDRIYPCENYFLEEDADGNTVEVPYKSDSFLFIPNHNSFSGVDYIEVLLESTSEVNAEELTFEFSEFEKGYAPMVTLVGESKTIPANTIDTVVFKTNKSTTMFDATRNVSGIKSLTLKTPDDSSYTIYDVIFRWNNAQYTLEEIDRFIDSGKYYIVSRLHSDYETLPPELADHVYTAAAGYAWLGKWEFESRIMNDEQKNAKSYGKWLFAVVDDAIEDWKITNDIDEDIVYVMDDLSDYRWLRW